jgi:hypothetical protein
MMKILMVSAVLLSLGTHFFWGILCARAHDQINLLGGVPHLICFWILMMEEMVGLTRLGWPNFVGASMLETSALYSR